MEYHSQNLYTFENAFGHRAVAPYLERGSVLDTQKTVTVKGTLLQNRDYVLGSRLAFEADGAGHAVGGEPANGDCAA
ncbi:MAG TPA: hypothetical protein VII06_24455 [Chloroflexota bacterium]